MHSPMPSHHPLNTPQPSRQHSPILSIAAVTVESRRAVAMNAIFRRPGSSPQIFAKCPRILSFRNTPCHATSVNSFRAVAGPSRVMCPNIDGIIREARLGLDMVYVQAKKWRL